MSLGVWGGGSTSHTVVYVEAEHTTESPEGTCGGRRSQEEQRVSWGAVGRGTHKPHSWMWKEGTYGDRRADGL